MDLLDTPAPRTLSNQLGSLISSVFDDEFFQKLFSFVGHYIPFDSGHVIEYDTDGAPTVLHDGRPDPYEPLYEYVSGYFLLDPLWTKIESRNLTDKTYNLNTLAPDSFFESSYYEQHYGKAQIVDEVGWIIPQSNTIQIVVCLMRRWDSSPFAKDQIYFMQVSHPILASVVGLHQKIRHQQSDCLITQLNTDMYHSPSDFINRQLRTTGQGTNQLSDRQSDVVNLILQGHSTESIGLNLKISAGTVKTHKRDIYSKLGISSHGELFKLFVDAMQRNANRS